MKMSFCASVIFSLLLSSFQGGLTVQCGTQAGGALCPNGLCCSQWGYCATTTAYCDDGCQSQCSGGGGGGGGGGGEGGDIGSIISSDDFDQLLPYRNAAACPVRNFYTYDAFIEAANFFLGFGTTEDIDIRKREIVAFLGQTSHETTGGWPTAPGGPYSWGYCFIRKINGGLYCAWNPNYPYASSQEYYGRGPIQLSWNYNYGQCGEALELDLLNNPDLVAIDPVISVKAAIWFWMTPQSPKPSCHDVITGNWNLSIVDIAAGQLFGYGTTTNIINGGLECGRGMNAQVENRIGFYKRYCEYLGVDYGDNLDCYSQSPFGNGLLVDTM